MFLVVPTGVRLARALFKFQRNFWQRFKRINADGFFYLIVQ